MQTDASVSSYLIFGLRGSRYGVEAGAVREIVWLPELTPIAEEPGYVVGVVNLRGTMVPVLDLNVRLGRPPERYRLEDRLVVLQGEKGPAALIVHQVYTVQDFSAAEIQPVPVLGPAVVPETQFLSGLAGTGEHVVMLLHLENLLHFPEVLPELPITDEAPVREPAVSFCPDATPQERVVFQERARELAQPLAGQVEPGRIPFAVVRMSGELFGIDLDVVREFALVQSVTPVPCCPAHILGHINLRGELFTLVDLGAALGLPCSAASRAHVARKVVVLDLAGMALAVPVDDVLAVRYVQPGDIAPNPAAGTENAPFLRGSAPHGAQMLSILDLPRIFAQKQLSVYEEP